MPATALPTADDFLSALNEAPATAKAAPKKTMALPSADDFLSALNEPVTPPPAVAPSAGGVPVLQQATRTGIPGTVPLPTAPAGVVNTPTSPPSPVERLAPATAPQEMRVLPPKPLPVPRNVAPRRYNKPQSELDLAQLGEDRKRLPASVTQPGHIPGIPLQERGARETFTLAKWYNQDRPQALQDLHREHNRLLADKRQIEEMIAAGEKPSQNRLANFEARRRGIELRQQEIEGLAHRYEMASTGPKPGGVGTNAPIHGGLYYPEEVAQGVGQPTALQGLLSHASGFVAADVQAHTMRAALQWQGKGAMLTPIPYKDRARGIQEKNDLVNLVRYAPVSVLRDDGTIGEGGSPQFRAAVRRLTPFQKSLIAPVRANLELEREAEDLAEVGKHLGIDIAAAVAAEGVGAVVGNLLRGPGKVIVKRYAPKLFVRYVAATAPVLGAELAPLSRAALNRLVLRAAPEVAIHTITGAAAGGAASGTATALSGGNVQQVKEATGRGALLGAGLGAGTSAVSSVIAGTLRSGWNPKTTPGLIDGIVEAAKRDRGLVEADAPRFRDLLTQAAKAPAAARGRLIRQAAEEFGFGPATARGQGAPRPTMGRGEAIPPEPRARPAASQAPPPREAVTVEAPNPRATPPEVLRQQADAGDPVAASHLLQHEAWEVQQSAPVARNENALTAYAKTWLGSAEKKQHDMLSAAAAQNPALAERLQRAAHDLQKDHQYQWTRQNVPEMVMEPEIGPPSVSVWRQMTPEERAALPAPVRRTLLLQDAANSARVLDPKAAIVPPKVTDAGLEKHADELFAAAQQATAPPAQSNSVPAQSQAPEAQIPAQSAGQSPAQSNDQQVTAQVINPGEAITGAARGITEGLTDALWAKAQAGNITEAGQTSAVMQAIKALRDRGKLQTREEVGRFAREFAQIKNQRDDGAITSEQFQQQANDLLRQWDTASTETPVTPAQEAVAPGIAENAIVSSPEEVAQSVGLPAEPAAPAQETPAAPVATREPTELGPGRGAPPSQHTASGRVSDYTPVLFRETTLDDAAHILHWGGVPTDGPAGYPRLFFANTSDQALGQGANRGVLIEMDSAGMRGDVNRSKPAWEAAWNAGSAEWAVSGRDVKRDQIRSITYPRKVPKAQVPTLKNLRVTLDRMGWTRTEHPNGFVIYTRPDVAPLDAEALPITAQESALPADLGKTGAARTQKAGAALAEGVKAGAARTKVKGEAKAAVQPPARPERRQPENAAQRKRVAEMSPEEKTAEIERLRGIAYNDKMTGVPTRAAYEEADKKAHTAVIDGDSLKWWNDEFKEEAGYAGGDALLGNVGRALREAGLEAYRTGGDEFTAQADTPEELQQKIAFANDYLKGSTVEFKTLDGRTIRRKGAEITWGIAPTMEGEAPNAAAAAELGKAKEAREAAGTRTTGGKRPPGVVEVPEEGGTPEGEQGLARDTAEPGRGGVAQEEARAEVGPQGEPAATPVVEEAEAPTRAVLDADLKKGAVIQLDKVTVKLTGRAPSASKSAPKDWEATVLASEDAKVPVGYQGSVSRRTLLQGKTSTPLPVVVLRTTEEITSAAKPTESRLVPGRRLRDAGTGALWEIAGPVRPDEHGQAFVPLKVIEPPEKQSEHTTPLKAGDVEEHHVAHLPGRMKFEVPPREVKQPPKGFKLSEAQQKAVADVEAGLLRKPTKADLKKGTVFSIANKFVVELTMKPAGGMWEGRVLKTANEKTMKVGTEGAIDDNRLLFHGKVLDRSVTPDPAANPPPLPKPAAKPRVKKAAGEVPSSDPVIPGMGAWRPGMKATLRDGSVLELLKPKTIRQAGQVHRGWNVRMIKSGPNWGSMEPGSEFAIRSDSLIGATPEAGQKGGEVRRQPQEQQRAGTPPEEENNLPRVIPQPGAGGQPPAKPNEPRQFGQYSDPAVNALIHDNRGVSHAAGPVQALAEMGGRLARIATREFEHIPNDPALYEFRDLIRHVARAGKVISQDEAVIKHARALDKLNPQETQVLGDHFLLHGMAEDVETQRAAHRERVVGGQTLARFEPLLPLDPKTGEAWTEARLEQALAENDADVESNEAVQDAIARAREMNDSVWDGYWNLSEDVQGRERPEKKQTYFRHKMVAYQAAARLANSGALGPKAKRVIRSATNFSFLKRRVGSNLLYDTDWITTQMDWMPQMLLGTKKLALLKHVQDKMDITRDLHLEALDINDDLFVPYLQSLGRVFGREVEKGNEQGASRERQAAVVKLARLASEGALPDAPSGKFAVMLTHLAANHQLNVDREANGFTQRINVPPIALDQVPEYVEWLRGSGAHTNVIPRHNPNSRAARRNQVGKERVEPADLIPDGYVEWRGAPGTILSDAATMPEQLQAAIVQAAADQVGLPAAELSHLQKRVSWHRSLIIREEAARTLDNILERDPDSPEAFISRLLQYGLGQWKATKITFPTRAINYYLHNGAGDLTNFVRATGGDPRAFQRYVGSSNQMLRELFRGQVPSEIVELYFQQGASANIQTSAEGIGTGTGIDILGKFTNRRASKPARFLTKIKNLARNPHDLREHTLRLALFRYYYEHLEQHGVPPNYGASNPQEIEALTSNARKAWNLSNDAMVSYDRTTEGGRWLAKHLYPFFRWREGNARAQIGFARNALLGADARLMAATGRKLAGKSLPFVWSLQLARAALLAANGLAWAYTWNKLLGGQKVREADEKLSAEIRHRPHFTFIDPVTGRTLTFDRFDPMTDFASNFAIDNIGGYLESINKGWMAPGELPKAMIGDTLSGHLNSLGPQWQVMLRMTGQSTFPNFFEPRPVMDQMETLFDELNLGGAWRWYLGRPQKRSTWTKMLTGTNVVDIPEGAYYEVRDLADSQARRIGRPRDKGGSAESSEKSSSAYWFRQSARFSDSVSAALNLLAYQRAGGDDREMAGSLKKMEPLSGLPPSERVKFLAKLGPDDAERVRLAYYHWASLAAPEFDVRQVQSRDITDFVMAMRANLSGIGGSPGMIDQHVQGLMEGQRREHPELEEVRTKRMEDEILQRVLRKAGG